MKEVAGWTDLFIDQAATRAALGRMGMRTAPPKGVICHWSTYLRPGLFGLYRAVMAPGAPDILDRLNAALALEARRSDKKRPRLGLLPL
jgi:hypothetical protein